MPYNFNYGGVVNTGQLEGVIDPVNPQDGATKKYVDSKNIYINDTDTSIDGYTIKDSTDIRYTVNTVDSEVTLFVVNGSITADRLASNAVITTKILDKNVTLAKLADDVTVSALPLPTTDLNMNNNKITSVADPTMDNHAANKRYVDTHAGTIAPGDSAGYGIDIVDDANKHIINVDTETIVDVGQLASTEASIRSDLNTRIDSEVQERKDSDTAIRSEIATEVTARKDSDIAIRMEINAEVIGRKTRDSELVDLINQDRPAGQAYDNLSPTSADFTRDSILSLGQNEYGRSSANLNDNRVRVVFRTEDVLPQTMLNEYQAGDYLRVRPSGNTDQDNIYSITNIDTDGTSTRIEVNAFPIQGDDILQNDISPIGTALSFAVAHSGTVSIATLDSDTSGIVAHAPTGLGTTDYLLGGDGIWQAKNKFGTGFTIANDGVTHNIKLGNGLEFNTEETPGIAIDTNITATVASVNTLETKVDNNLTTLTARIDSEAVILDAQRNEHDSDVTALNARIDSEATKLNAQIVEHDSDITVLTARIDSEAVILDALKVEHDSDVTKIYAEIDSDRVTAGDGIDDSDRTFNLNTTRVAQIVGDDITFAASDNAGDARITLHTGDSDLTMDIRSDLGIKGTYVSDKIVKIEVDTDAIAEQSDIVGHATGITYASDDNVSPRVTLQRHAANDIQIDLPRNAHGLHLLSNQFSIDTDVVVEQKDIDGLFSGVTYASDDNVSPRVTFQRHDADDVQIDLPRNGTGLTLTGNVFNVDETVIATRAYVDEHAGTIDTETTAGNGIKVTVTGSKHVLSVDTDASLTFNADGQVGVDTDWLAEQSPNLIAGLGLTKPNDNEIQVDTDVDFKITHDTPTSAFVDTLFGYRIKDIDAATGRINLLVFSYNYVVTYTSSLRWDEPFNGGIIVTNTNIDEITDQYVNQSNNWIFSQTELLLNDTDTNITSGTQNYTYTITDSQIDDAGVVLRMDTRGGQYDGTGGGQKSFSFELATNTGTPAPQMVTETFQWNPAGISSVTTSSPTVDIDKAITSFTVTSNVRSTADTNNIVIRSISCNRGTFDVNDLSPSSYPFPRSISPSNGLDSNIYHGDTVSGVVTMDFIRPTTVVDTDTEHRTWQDTRSYSRTVNTSYPRWIIRDNNATAAFDFNTYFTSLDSESGYIVADNVSRVSNGSSVTSWKSATYSFDNSSDATASKLFLVVPTSGQTDTFTNPDSFNAEVTPDSSQALVLGHAGYTVAYTMYEFTVGAGQNFRLDVS